MKQTKILLIEDDVDIREMVVNFLQAEDYVVTTASDGKAALTEFQNTPDYDLILLDLMLPKKSGTAVLQEIRQESYIPIIIISAKDSDFDKSLLLEIGADDYVTKPFSLIELNARIKSCLRRTNEYQRAVEPESKVITFLDLTLDIGQYTLTKATTKIPLTSTEFEIIKLFLTYPKKVFTKEDIYQSVWKENYYGDEHLVNVHMSRLREKLEEDSKNPKYIETLWGIGYRLKA